MKITFRNPLAVILLTIFTCGIYPIYYVVVATDEVHASIDDNGEWTTPGILALVFGWLTCGIYIYYWAYKMANKIGNKTGNDIKLVTLLLCFVFSPGAYALLANEANKIA